VAGCGCPEGHVDPLGASSELVFPWAGVLVLPGDYELYGELATGPARHDFGGPLHQFQHGIVHFVQALGSRSCTTTGSGCFARRTPWSTRREAAGRRSSPRPAA
jgi:hypothetical protein